MRPDLNPPENVWFIMVRETKEELRQPVHQPSADQLWQAVQAEWDQSFAVVPPASDAWRRPLGRGCDAASRLLAAIRPTKVGLHYEWMQDMLFVCRLLLTPAHCRHPTADLLLGMVARLLLCK